jgi:hypothetical protein
MGSQMVSLTSVIWLTSTTWPFELLTSSPFLLHRLMLLKAGLELAGSCLAFPFRELGF